jgi:hypothetical protein
VPWPVRQLRRAHAQQLHDAGRAAERIGDRVATVERERGPESAVDLRDQHLAGWDTGTVELGQGLEPILVGRGGEPEDDACIGLISHGNLVSSIAG